MPGAITKCVPGFVGKSINTPSTHSIDERGDFTAQHDGEEDLSRVINREILLMLRPVRPVPVLRPEQRADRPPALLAREQL